MFFAPMCENLSVKTHATSSMQNGDRNKVIIRLSVDAFKRFCIFADLIDPIGYRLEVSLYLGNPKSRLGS